MAASPGSATGTDPAVAIPMRDFRVDGWLVQPARNRLVKGTTAVRVRPQLMDVLACLAMQPGKVMSRDHLLAVVWSDRYVASSGVARCMAELRHVLADDARQPRIIETIPKRGYRLIAPVEPVDGPAPAPRPPDRESTVAAPPEIAGDDRQRHPDGRVGAGRLLAAAAALGRLVQQCADRFLG